MTGMMKNLFHLTPEQSISHVHSSHAGVTKAFEVCLVARHFKCMARYAAVAKERREAKIFCEIE